MSTVAIALIALLWLLAAEVFWLDGRTKTGTIQEARAVEEVRALRIQTLQRKEVEWWIAPEGHVEASGRIACTRPAN